MSEYLQTIRLFSPSLRRLYLTVGCVITVAFGIMAVLFNLYLLRLGFDARYIGLLAGLGQLVWAAAALPAGILSNRIGLRNSMQLGAFLFGLSIALMLLVERLPQPQWQAWLLGGQVLLNIGVALMTVTLPPYVMFVTSERERRHAFAFLAALIPAAALVGSIIAGVLPGLLATGLNLTLDQPAPYRLALWLGPALAWIGILPLRHADAGRLASRGGEPGYVVAGNSSPLPLGLLAFWGLVVFMAAIGEGAVRTFFNVFMDEALQASPATIGTVMGAAQLLPIGIALLLPPLLARWGTRNTMSAGTVGMALCLAALASATQVWLAASAYIGIFAVLTLVSTSRDMLGQELVAPIWRTSSQGAAMVGMSLGWAAAGVVGGALIEATGFGALYLAGALTSLAAAGMLWGYGRYTRRPRPRQVPAT